MIGRIAAWILALHGGAALVLLGAVVTVVVLAARWAGRHQQRLRVIVTAQLDRAPLAWIRARYEREIPFLTRRLRPGGAFGLSLTASLAALVGVGWVLGRIVPGRGGRRRRYPP